MALQYKPTKQKKEKPVRAPKAPKPEKAMKIAPSVTVKTSKPAKDPKQPRSPKAEKSLQFTPSVKMGKVEKASKFDKSGVLQKSINPKVAVGIVLALTVIAAAIIAVGIPAAEKAGMEIDHIMISSTPDKTVYLVGESVNYDGLRVLVTRKNGETFTVRAAVCEITGFDSTKAAESQMITVTYEGFTTSYNIVVKEAPKPTPALVRISLETLPKTEYKVGEWLDTTGGVILCEYKDGSVYHVSLVNSDVFGFVTDSKTGAYVAQKPGTYELTVKYMENGVICETTYTITVTE